MGGQTSRWLVSSAVFAFTIVFVVSGLPGQTAGFTTSNSVFSFSKSTAASLGSLGGTASQQAGIISERVPALPDGYFVENRGQVKNEQVRFYVRSSDLQVGLARGRILYDVFQRPLFPTVDARQSSENLTPHTTIRGVQIQLSFEGGNPVDPEGRLELPFRTHYLVGAEPRDWVTDLRAYGEVTYENLYDGIDLAYRTTAQGVKYEFLVHPWADPSKISISVDGSLGLRVADGALVLSTSIGDMVDSAPIAYEVTGALVTCGFAVRGVASYGFECGARDPSQPLIIDPLVYSTFVGGSTYEVGYGLAVDASGNAYVTGITSSPDFPVTPGAFDTSFSGIDAFVAKLNPTGSALTYATFLGGSSGEQGLGIAVDLTGNVYVTGMTWSADFPTTPGAPDSSFNGGVVDGFVAKLNATGATLIYGTYLGGSGEDDPFALAVDASGNVVVAGRTESGNFPATPGAFDTSFNGWTDGFVARLNAAGTLFTYVTFLGGWSIDYVAGVAIDSGGQAVVAGRTDSFDFPATAGAYDPSYDNGDAFITKLTATGSALVFSTFLGGTSQDEAWGLTIDSSGALYVCGDTASGDFPATPGSFDTTSSGGGDAFVAKVTGTGASLVYATYLGGASEERANVVAVDGAGNAFVIGETTSADFPTTPGAFDSTYAGGTGLFDGFVTEIDSNGAGLRYGTYFGGDHQDLARAGALDSMGNVIFAGYSESRDFPVTPGAFDMIQRTGKAYVAKLGPVPSVATPVLAWTGEPNYVADGVDPQLGGTTTTFRFRVVYSDSDNDPPVPIRVDIEKPLGSTWGTFRMSLDRWVGAPFDYSAGARFAFSTTLSPVGLDYYYAFNATDGRAWAGGAPATPSSGPIVDDPPTALPRASKTTAYLLDPIVFDGSGSTDDFGVVAFLWTFGDGQTDSNAVATHSFSSRTVFLVVLSVWDARGQMDNDSLQVEIQNRAPVADAGLDQSSYKYTLVTLDGTRSSDPDRDPLTFQWVQTGGPPVILTAANTSSPSFTPMAAGSYLFSVTVDDGWGGVAVDSTVVTIENRLPTAVAGPDQVANKRALVTLNGTGSTDPDGDSLQYSWVQTGGPSVTLSGSQTPQPTFVPLISGVYVFQLTVDDGDGGMGTASVRITVTNRPPVADAGLDQSAWKRTVVTLDGIGSSDPDGDSVTYWWEQIGGPYVAVNNATAATAWIFPLVQGTYTFRLHVDDGDSLGTDTADVSVTVWSRPPAASLTVTPDPARLGATIHFDGSGSFDPDGSIVNYDFRFGDGSSATGSAASEDHAYTAPGTYLATLTVTDDDGNTSSAEGSVTIATNLPPLAALAIWPGPTGTKATVFRFDGLNSTDPDGTITSWSWSFGDGMASTGPQVSHTYARSGSFTTTLTVTDNEGGTDTDTLVVSVVNRPPQIVSTDPTRNVSIAAGASQTFTVNAVDPDGDPLTYTWRVDGANVGGSASTYVFRRDAAGTYRIKVTASDGEAEASTEWSVTVRSAEGPAITGPMFWVLVVAVAGIAVVIVVLLWRRKRKAEPAEPPADGR